MIENSKTIVVFAAHPDDEVMGCGGSIAKYVDSGKTVEIVYMTPSRNNKQRKLKEEEARNAAKVLGVNNIFFFGEHDRHVSYNQTTLNKTIRLLRKEKADLVFVPHPEEADRDHKATYEIVNEAVWLTSSQHMPHLGKSHSVLGLFLYEVWTPLKDFQLIEDVTNFMSKKTKALQQYKSQLSTVRYDEAIRGLNRYRGLMTSAGDYAEVFKIKSLKESLAGIIS